MQNKEFVNSIKKKEIKVSVIIPVYNIEKHLERCLESIVFQTLCDIEIIVINDGSTDNSSKIIEKFLPDKRFIYVKQDNQGVSAARNRGLALAKGKYISFIDSDDYIDNDFLEKLYKANEKTNSDIAASSIIRKRETYEKWRINYPKTKTITDKKELFETIRYPNQSYVWNKLYRKSFLEKINFKFKEGVYYGDVLAVLDLLLNCEKLVVVANTNYYYMVNEGISTVKSKTTPKKEEDRYNAQKYAVETIIKKGIKIKRPEYFIKKWNIKFFGIPILKVKEDLLAKKELFLLFNMIPVLYMKKKTLLGVKMFFKRFFSISRLDSHLLIFIFFIKLNIKYKTKYEPVEVKTTGIETNKRDVKIIASLTSSPERIKSVSTTIKTLMKQTLRPDEIVLYLVQSQFPNAERSLPCELLDLKKFGLTIKWTENDTKSYKKLIPALIDYPEDIIITFDDDIYYEKDTIEVLYNSYLEHPDEIQANRTWTIEVKNNKLVPVSSAYMYWNYKEYRKGSFFNTIIGCGGVLYPPKCLYKDVFDEKKFREHFETQDDLWFYLMAVLNGTKIRLNKGYSYSQIPVENTQHTGLYKINKSKKGGLLRKEGFSKMSELYPEVVEILKVND